jgi:hypothetical protein
LSVIGAGGGAGSYVAFLDGGTRKGYFGQFGASGLIWQQDAPSISINLNPNGNIYLNGPANFSSNVSISGQLNVGGSLIAPNWLYVGDGSFQLSAAPSERYLQFAGSWFWGWNTSTGRLRWVGNPGVPTELFTIDGSGNTFVRGSFTVSGPSSLNGPISTNGINCTSLVSSGDVNAVGNSFAHGAFYCDNAGGGFFHRDGAGNLGMQIYCNTSNNNATWVNNRTGKTLTMNAASQFISSMDLCAKPTAGSWASSSDKRIKDVLGGYKAGLKEILQLKPVEFTFKGNDTDTKDGVSIRAELAKDKKKLVGFVADDIMKVLPETVSLEKGFIDGEEVNDLKYLDITNVTHALVNAIKELHAEVQALKAVHR